MLRLTEAQSAAVRDFEVSSFQKYCSRFHLEPAEFERDLFVLMKSRFESLCGSEIPAGYEVLSHARTYSEFNIAEQRLRQRSYCRLLAQHWSKLPLSQPFLDELCCEYGLPPVGTGTPESILTFVEAVPLIWCWDPEFNAFVTHGTIVQGLPYICMYEALTAAVHAFIHCTIPVVLNIGEKIAVRPLAEAEALGSDEGFMDCLRSCFELALGLSNQASFPPINDRETLICAAGLAEGGAMTVWLHEIGHLLLGHLKRAPSHGIELEADRFAFTLLSAEAEWDYPGYMLGGIAVYILMEMLEAITCAPPSSSHPTGERRLMEAFRMLRHESARYFGFAEDYLVSVGAACAPTLKRYWQLDFSYL